MRLHRDLLEQARHLLGRESRRPRQASLRRAISDAYYAVFHLLTYEAARIFVAEPATIKILVRTYDHGRMAKISRIFAAGDLPRKLHPFDANFTQPGRRAVFDAVRDIAKGFLILQSGRHEADYDLLKNYTRREAGDIVALAETVFANWDQIRKDDLARIYLSCFLVYDDWNKER